MGSVADELAAALGDFAVATGKSLDLIAEQLYGVQRKRPSAGGEETDAELRARLKKAWDQWTTPTINSRPIVTSRSLTDPYVQVCSICLTKVFVVPQKIPSIGVAINVHTRHFAPCGRPCVMGELDDEALAASDGVHRENCHRRRCRTARRHHGKKR